MNKNETPTPHKHAELIKKWADDTSIRIQYKYSGTQWNDCAKTPEWNECNEYRIKPEVIRYRVALFNDGKPEKWTQTANNNIEEMKFKKHENFSEWITDWIEVDIND